MFHGLMGLLYKNRNDKNTFLEIILRGLLVTVLILPHLVGSNLEC